MLYSMNSLLDYEIKAKDGKIGKVDDFFFDSENWNVRYIIDKTGFLFFGKHILLSLSSVEEVAVGTENIVVNLKKEQIENSATIEAKKTVSREKEKSMADDLNWPAYWSGAQGGMNTAFTSGAFPNQGFIMRDIQQSEENKEDKKDDDEKNTLRSYDETKGYKVDCTDGKLGKVEDLIFDEKGAVRYIVVDAKYLDCKDKDFVLVSPEWINYISWYKKEFSVDIEKNKFENCPSYEELKSIDRSYETALYNYFNKQHYWRR